MLKSLRLFSESFDKAVKSGIMMVRELFMELDYTYREAEEGGYVGYFNDFPQHVTQGETLEELEEMLLDMYECLHLEKYHKRKLAIA